MSRTIRVLLAEDQSMVREALAALLGLEPDIEVVAQVARGDEVLAAARAHAVDVALLDIEMPGATGIEAAAAAAPGAPGGEARRPHHLRPPRLSAPRHGGRRRRASWSRTRPAAQLAEAVRQGAGRRAGHRPHAGGGRARRRARTR